jgi:hypothetical protein
MGSLINESIEAASADRALTGDVVSATTTAGDTGVGADAGASDGPLRHATTANNTGPMGHDLTAPPGVATVVI